jgi:hypothetical protein
LSALPGFSWDDTGAEHFRIVWALFFLLYSDTFSCISNKISLLLFSMPNVSPSALSADERRVRSQLHALLSKADGLLHGSLIEMSRRCGKASCRCASDDAARHRSLYLGQTSKGKTVLTYIPAALESLVRQWTADFLRAADLLEALNSQARLRLAAAKIKAPPSAKPSAKLAKPKAAAAGTKVSKSSKSRTNSTLS